MATDSRRPRYPKVLAVTKNSGLHDFAFDRVFGERSSQPQVYEAAARRLVMEFLNGTSASIICCLVHLYPKNPKFQKSNSHQFTFGSFGI